MAAAVTPEPVPVASADAAATAESLAAVTAGRTITAKVIISHNDLLVGDTVTLPLTDLTVAFIDKGFLEVVAFDGFELPGLL